MPVVLYARSCDSTAHSMSYEENVDIFRFSTSFFKFTKYINNFYHFDLFFHLCIWHRVRKIRNRLEIISGTVYIQSVYQTVQLLIIHKILCYSNWLFDMNITEKKARSWLGLLLSTTQYFKTKKWNLFYWWIHSLITVSLNKSYVFSHTCEWDHGVVSLIFNHVN